MRTNYGPRPGLTLVDAELCAECHRPILDTDATDESGTLHFEPCAGQYAQRMTEQAVDRAREREMFRDWGSRS